MLQVRPVSEDDREAVAVVGGLSFNYVPQVDDIVLAGKLCAVDGDRLAAIATAIPFQQWFGGRQVACAGVAGVAVLPEYRGQGVAGHLLGALLAGQRQAGRAFSALYPANAALYRKLGYEYGGLRPQFCAPIADLPPARGQVDDAGPLLTAELMQCFSRFVAPHNGPVETLDSGYFERRMLAHGGEGNHQRTVVVSGGGAEDAGVAGYASYYLGKDPPGNYRLTCRHLVARTPGALSALLGYFRRFENAAKELAWYGPPGTAPVGLALLSNGFSLQPTLERWMGRVLDVPAALEARGYPEAHMEVVIEVDDALFPQNRGPWLVQAEGGRSTVLPVPDRFKGTGSGARPVPIGALSALFTGYASAQDLVLTGALAPDDDRVGLLSALFAGPTPWMPDFF